VLKVGFELMDGWEVTEVVGLLVGEKVGWKVGFIEGVGVGTMVGKGEESTEGG